MINKILKQEFAAYQYIAELCGLTKFVSAEEYAGSKFFRKAVVPANFKYNLDKQTILSYLFRIEPTNKITYNQPNLVLPTLGVKVSPKGEIIEMYEYKAISNAGGIEDGTLTAVGVSLCLKTKAPLEYYIWDYNARTETKYDFNTHEVLRQSIIDDSGDQVKELFEKAKKDYPEAYPCVFHTTDNGTIIEMRVTEDFLG